MELLRQHGLYGGGLVEIDDPLLVERYNGCLTEIGEKPTSLNRFQIDGRGWSPEIAAEKHNDAYLSHGGAMQYTILLTPEQKGKPIHNAYFSFERALLAFLFDKAGDAIARVTSSTGVWVQLDPGLSEFEQLSDLTMVRSINVTLGDQKHLIEAAEEQRKLRGGRPDPRRICDDADVARIRPVGGGHDRGRTGAPRVHRRPLTLSGLGRLDRGRDRGRQVGRGSGGGGRALGCRARRRRGRR